MPSGTRWQLVVGFMAAAITRARIRHTAAEAEEVLPPFSLRLWDPLDVLDPLLDGLERSPFFFFFLLFLLFPPLSSLADGAAGLGGDMAKQRQRESEAKAEQPITFGDTADNLLKRVTSHYGPQSYNA